MEVNIITFERLANDYDIGNIRSVTVDHVRGILTVVSDKNLPNIEGQTIPTNKTFTTNYDENEAQQ